MNKTIYLNVNNKYVIQLKKTKYFENMYQMKITTRPVLVPVLRAAAGNRVRARSTASA